MDLRLRISIQSSMFTRVNQALGLPVTHNPHRYHPLVATGHSVVFRPMIQWLINYHSGNGCSQLKC
ncbi:hypothetical protein L873DRAFT_1798589 [Choiromyces venosus 120613-1]|uniref:Uncharacterized protein n=1 Tax=Choiromyces venosus 120613-1 TaxID=1336337 RepID=A0A3N4K2L0_9PEZI|nr:hypothetical protein L873DRAFT_1798589 [Choiromyces venosus 120613-1]